MKDKWWGNFSEYVAFVRKENRAPKSNSTNKRERCLYQWMHNQAHRAASGFLSADRVEALKTFGFLDRPINPVRTHRQRFEDHLNAVVAFRVRNGFDPIKNGDSSDSESNSAQWLCQTRKKFEEQKLSDEQKDLFLSAGLNIKMERDINSVKLNISSSSYEPVEIEEALRKRKPSKPVKKCTYEEHIKEYIQFKELNKRNPSSTKSEYERRLYLWMYQETLKIKKGTISDEHYNMLKEAGVDIPNRGNQSERNINRKLVRESDYIYDAGADVSMHMANYLAKVEACRRSFPLPKTTLYKWVQKEFKFSGAQMKPWQREAWEKAGIPIRPLRREGSVRCFDVRVWEMRYETYRSFVAANHRAPKQGGDKTERSLYFWQADEKKFLRANARTEEQIVLLRNVGITIAA